MAAFYLLIFEGSKAIDRELFQVSMCLLSDMFYNALNYITLILNWLDLEVVSVPKVTTILVLFIPVQKNIFTKDTVFIRATIPIIYLLRIIQSQGFKLQQYSVGKYLVCVSS